MTINVLSMKIVASILSAVFGIVAAAQAAGDPQPFVRTQHELLMEMRDGAEATVTNGVTWKLGVESAAIAGQPDAQDHSDSRP